MDARKVLDSWPGLERLEASAILAHPAWKMPVGYADDGMSLVLDASDAPDADELRLAITLDDVDNVLGLSDSPFYPDLHRLWTRRGELPDALLIALVEKEANLILQTLENFSRKELRIQGLVSGEQADKLASRRTFRLMTPTGELGFSVHLPSDVVVALGVLDNLDPMHDSIRSLTRTARAQYASIAVASKSEPALAAGDYLLAPEAERPTWQEEIPTDDSFRILSADEQSFAFAQFADETLPAVPPPSALTVFRRGRQIASAKVSRVGDTPAYEITTTY